MHMTVSPVGCKPLWRGVLRNHERAWPCALGVHGIVRCKREGDGATPAGCFPVRCVLWRADRLPRPKTALPTLPLTRRHGWCDAPRHPAYNRLITLPCRASHERLWRASAAYDVLAVLGVNDRPPRPGRGSAIFLHVAEPLAPTRGCIALAKDALLEVLALARLSAKLNVTTHP